MVEDEAESSIKDADKKAKQALAKHDFKLLTQSVALQDKGQAMISKEVAEQKKVVHLLHSKLVQKP